jgi:TonB family protein
MKALESWLLTYLLNSLWQVPLVFAAAGIATRAVRRSSVAMEHRIWVSALVLQGILPACTVRSGELFRGLWSLMLQAWGTGAAAGKVSVTLATGTAVEHGAFQLPAPLLLAIAVAYGGSLIYFAGRLAYGLWKTAALRQQADRIALTGEAGRSWDRCCQSFAVNNAEAAESRNISGPVTIGIRRRLLLLPAGWQASLLAEDLDVAITHEFAHMHRRDFAKNLAYELLSLPIAYHPLLWLTRARIAESREMICDAIAADHLAGREKYARSLLRLASMLTEPAPARTLHAIGIFDANIFERRVMNLTEKRVELRGIRRIATAAACVVLGLGACASALALRLEISAPVAQSESQQGSPVYPSARVSSAVMQGNLLTKVNPIYPAGAKTAGISGTVVLHAIISKDGTIEKLNVVSGPDELQGSAVEAVRQWTYRPYLLNGEPTAVETTITVNYNLAQ